MVTNSTNQVKKLSEYTPDELKAELKTAADNGDFARVQEVSKELLNIGKKEHAKVEFNEKQKEMLEKIANKTATPDEVKDFVENDLKEYKGDTDQRMKNIEEFKDKKIEDLEKQLQEKDDQVTDLNKTLTELPGFTDYFSPERRRFVKLAKKIDTIKAKSNDPKDILIYCMAATKRKVFGSREAIKRGRIKLFRRKKDTEIVKELETIKAKLAPVAGEKTHRKLLKEMLLKEISAAQVKYYEQLKNKIVG